MKSVKILCLLLFSFWLFCLPLSAESQQTATGSSHAENINNLEHDHVLENYYHQHEHHIHSPEIHHHHHHHHHHHEDGDEICPYCGHAHHVEDQIVKYETLDAKYHLLKHKALLFFVLAFCLIIFNWLFKKKLKRG